MADSTVQEWMEAQNVQVKETIALDIAGSIDLGVMDFASFLHELQPYLNQNATRIEAGDGIKLLSLVVSSLQGDLNRIDLHALVEYLCSRLRNEDQIPNFEAGFEGTARSLEVLANMTTRFPPADASVVAKAIFSIPSTSLRKQLPPVRLHLFELVDFLLKTYSVALIRDIGPEIFVEGLVSIAEFEKDPYCLKVLFQIYTHISQSWSLSTGSFKAIWDSCSRYFPITLKIENIRDELQLLLLQCFTSHDNYAAYTFEHLKEALDQGTLTVLVKNTVLETFEACVASYSIPIVAEWAPKIWDALKFEVWDGTNEEYITRSISVFRAIVRRLDNGDLDWKSLETPLARFAINTSTECSHRLQDSKPQHVSGSGQILHVIGSASHLAFDLLIRNVLPRMFLIWSDMTSRDKKMLFLGAFNEILQARLDLRRSFITTMLDPYLDRNIAQTLQNSETAITVSLASFQQSLVDDVLIAAMMEQDIGETAVDTLFQTNAIKGLVLGARIPAFLTDGQKGMIISEFNDRILQRTLVGTIHSEVVSALQQISIEDPDRFCKIIAPKVVGALPKCTSSNKDEVAEEMKEILFILEALTKISCTATCKVDFDSPPERTAMSFKFRLFDEFQSRLMQKIFGAFQLPDQLPYINAILAAMYHGMQLFDEVLRQEVATGDGVPTLSPLIGPYTWIIKELYGTFLREKRHESGSLAQLSYMGFNVVLDQNQKVNDTFVSLLGRIATLVLGSDQTTPLNNFLLNADRDADKKSSQVWCLFCREQPKESIDLSEQNLEWGPAEKCLANVLSMSLIAGVRREDKDHLKISVSNAAVSMIKNAISVKNNECSAYARVSMLHFLQLLINKFGAAKEKIENDDRTLAVFMTELATSCTTKTDELEIERTYQTLAYFAAACLASGDRSDKDLIAQMILGITNPIIGRKVAQAFRILLAPSQIMNEQNFCVIRKLRKQRLYGLTVDNIVTMWRGNTNKTEKENCLIALAGIFAFMEPNILHENAATIFPLILEGTNVQNDDQTMYTYIIMIRTLVIACPEAIAGHVDSIINRMTDRTHNTYDSPSDASVKCRTAALEVISLLVNHVERRRLLQKKAKVMVELDAALDDCSRTVRSAAERTKMVWFNLVEAEN